MIYKCEFCGKEFKSLDEALHHQEDERRHSTGHGNTGNFNTGDFNAGDCNTGHRNVGYYNTGDRNTGNCNSGDYNSGFFNSGYCNAGDFNAGDCNTGHRNVGYYNTGDRNTGNCNSGDYNSGFFNSGNGNSGYLNTDEPPMRIFNRETDKKREEIVFPNFFYDVCLCKWTYKSDMTEEEKKLYPEYKTTGGYIKTFDYKEAWLNAFNEAKKLDNWQDEKKKLLALPNFDYDIFEEITGITKDMIEGE